ncbi:LacI family DNA-binding transcriptional regulator [Collinsella sp. zg1085]|uniref:LacI family DNA-binding transcriptional regulator n=1 Tax=Collinsella sp. zg1085 TaxID=2844380 RepID=UPI001C0D8A2A|nr:LacI family DNA-binding transcriptional regulator [Collinsella sp. zg1085]QWT17218.1 LacI family DNA-binding transcriptional regulator [Collinsella sp. zg1085]
MAKVSIREISRVTGFSPATVSNALNHKRSVSEETAKLIFEAAQSMGYQQPQQLDTIQFVLARKNGKIVDESTFHPAVIEGVERQARYYNMSTSFVSLDFSDVNAIKGEIAQLVSDSSAAIVLLGTELGEADYALFEGAAAHIIVLDGWSNRFAFDSVVISNTDASFSAVNYLIERGHTRIFYLAGDFRVQNFKARELGYHQALEEAGIVWGANWMVHVGTTLESAYTDMSAWLDVVDATELPTAFFADNDVLAVGALRALLEHGLRVPEDISIIGFDDLPFGAFSNPPLTTVHVLKHEVGATAVRRLLGNIKNPKNYTCKTQINTYFVERESVRAL